MKTQKLLLLIFLGCSGYSIGAVADPEKDRKEIMNVLDKQVAAWNSANIDGFMEGYWKSDSLQFIGASITRGWKQTLERYKKSYPDKQAMGTLRFEILDMKVIDADAWLLTGKYFLTREKDNPSGVFTLLFRRIEGKWVIVYDHTCG